MLSNQTDAAGSRSCTAKQYPVRATEPIWRANACGSQRTAHVGRHGPRQRCRQRESRGGLFGQLPRRGSHAAAGLAWHRRYLSQILRARRRRLTSTSATEREGSHRQTAPKGPRARGKLQRTARTPATPTFSSPKPAKVSAVGAHHGSAASTSYPAHHRLACGPFFARIASRTCATQACPQAAGRSNAVRRFSQLRVRCVCQAAQARKSARSGTRCDLRQHTLKNRSQKLRKVSRRPILINPCAGPVGWQNAPRRGFLRGLRVSYVLVIHQSDHQCLGRAQHA